MTDEEKNEILNQMREFIPPVEKPDFPKSYRDPAKPLPGKLGGMSYSKARLLYPDELFQGMPARGEGEWTDEDIAYAKYTAADGRVWYITEVEELKDGDFFFNGYMEREGGNFPLQMDSFFLSELCKSKGIARDSEFKPTKVLNPSSAWADCDWGILEEGR